MKIVINKGSEDLVLLENNICHKLIQLGHEIDDDENWENDNGKLIVCDKINGQFLIKPIYFYTALRTHPDFIKLVECDYFRYSKDYRIDELNLVVIDIPDDVKWDIKVTGENGGYEIIVEKHRVWGEED
jgi:hypothetical protein